MRGTSMRLCAMRRCAMRRCTLRRPLRVPISITLALILALALCAACSGGPPRDHLDAAAIDAFFLPLIKAAREEATAQQAQTPDLRKTL